MAFFAMSSYKLLCHVCNMLASHAGCRCSIIKQSSRVSIRVGLGASCQCLLPFVGCAGLLVQSVYALLHVCHCRGRPAPIPVPVIMCQASEWTWSRQRHEAMGVLVLVWSPGCSVTSSASHLQTGMLQKHLLRNLCNIHIGVSLMVSARAWWSETAITSSYLFPARPDPSLPSPEGPVAQRCHCSKSAPSLKDLSVSAITRPPSCLLARAWRLQQQQEQQRLLQCAALEKTDGRRQTLHANSSRCCLQLKQSKCNAPAVTQDSSRHNKAQSWETAPVWAPSTIPW